jgi:chorismate synthase
MNNSLGKLFTITSFGESHGPVIGVVIDGCPAGLLIRQSDIQAELDRRKPAGPGTTSRQEKDNLEIFSGILDDHTTGAPIALVVRNADVDSGAYDYLSFKPRPGHADYTAGIKYGGFADRRGGGRFSGRITAGFVMAGAIAKKLLETIGVEICAHTIEIGGINAHLPEDAAVVRQRAEKNCLRCADSDAAERMVTAIEQAAGAGDSLGGIVEVIATGMPARLGEPVFDTLDGVLAQAFFSVPAVKGIEFGAGFRASRLRGSQNNDALAIDNGVVRTVTNNAGGINGGISNGMPLIARVALKPTPSISIRQNTIDESLLQPAEITITGRHDICIVPRAAIVLEAVAACTLADFALRAQILPGVIK